METAHTETVNNLLPPADWAGEIDRLKESISIEKDRNLRTLADFKNYRRRIERDGNKLAADGKKEIILTLLDIVDDMEKALHSAKNDHQPAVKGMEIIHQKFLALLGNYGVHPFTSVDKPFDHTMHEAVSMEKQDDGISGTVLMELRRGYLWNNELLRAAQVKVSGW